MSAAARARSLGRIAAVQAEMVKLAEWKLAAARRRRDDVDEERRLLAGLVSGDEALGAGLARAALRTAKALEARAARSEEDLARLRGDLEALLRRDRAVASMASEAKRLARHEAEAKALTETMEAWLARAGASLP